MNSGLPIHLNEADRRKKVAHLQDMDRALLACLKERGATEDGLQELYNEEHIADIPTDVLQSWLADSAERGLTTSTSRGGSDLFYSLTSEGRKRVTTDLVGTVLRGNGLVRIALPLVLWVGGGIALNPGSDSALILTGLVLAYFVSLGVLAAIRWDRHKKDAGVVKAIQTERARLDLEQAVLSKGGAARSALPAPAPTIAGTLAASAASPVSPASPPSPPSPASPAPPRTRPPQPPSGP